MTRRHLTIFIAVPIVSLVLFVLVSHFWQGDPRVPLGYASGGDIYFHMMLVKSTNDHGWFLHNPDLGQPTGQYLHDWPIADNFPMLLVKLISAFSDDPGLILNLYFILMFPLTALLAAWVLEKCGLATSTAAVLGLVYAFLPSHFQRGEFHLFLASYFMIPIAAGLSLWILRHSVNFPTRNFFSPKNSRNALIATGSLILIGSCNSYYSVFSIYMFTAAGFLASFKALKIRPMLISIVMSVVVFFTLIANISPSLVYFHKHGNLEIAKRAPSDAERYGLKISQLFIPIPGHRVGPFRTIRRLYEQNTLADLNNENRSSSLGVIGAVGFIVLLLTLLGVRLPTRDQSLTMCASQLNFCLILLATVGGLGSLISIYLSPQIRAYNRVSVIIAFFSLLALGSLIDGATDRSSTGGKQHLKSTLLLGLLVLGVADQTPRGGVLRNSVEDESTFSVDEEFTARIEELMPKDSKIFQLPYLPFPATPPAYQMKIYDHLRPFLHSTRLRWSFGALSGREADNWQLTVIRESSSPQELVSALRAKDFSGLYVDRYGYPDDGIEREIRAYLDADPLVSSNDRFVFYDLR